MFVLAQRCEATRQSLTLEGPTNDDTNRVADDPGPKDSGQNHNMAGVEVGRRRAGRDACGDGGDEGWDVGEDVEP